MNSVTVLINDVLASEQGGGQVVPRACWNDPDRQVRVGIFVQYMIDRSVASDDQDTGMTIQLFRQVQPVRRIGDALPLQHGFNGLPGLQRPALTGKRVDEYGEQIGYRLSVVGYREQPTA